MSEVSLQAALIDALSGVVRDGSILVNDYQTPQVASRDYAPWLILEAADDVTMTTGASYTTPSTQWELYVSLLTYRCLLYTSPSPRDRTRSRMPSSA